MTRPSDETLNAYADGELDPATAGEVEAYLNTDQTARNFVERLRQIDKLARKAVSAPMTEQPPVALVNAILSPPAGGEDISKVVELTPRASKAAPARWSTWRHAAMLALAVGAGLSYALFGRPTSDGAVLAIGPLDSTSEIAELLETGRSGEFKRGSDNALDSNRTATVASTFRDSKNRYCREIEVGSEDSGNPGRSASIACRLGSGVWTIEGSVALAGAEAKTSPEFEPSGSAKVEPLSELLTALGAAKALDAREEEAALSSGWK